MPRSKPKNRGLLRALFALGLLAAVWLAAAAPAAFPGGRGKVVESVEVVGNRRLSASAVLGRMKTRAGASFSQADLTEDLKRLYEWGPLARAEIDAREVSPGRIKVSVRVREKPVVDKVIFRGNRRIKDRRLGREVRIVAGEMVSEPRLREEVNRIIELYKKDGYLQTRVDYEIREDPDTGLAEVVFLIDEGSPVRINRIVIDGAEQIEEAELVKLMRTRPRRFFGIWRRGRLDPRQLEEDLERIALYYRHNGFLDARVVDVEKEYGPDRKRMEIRILVEEGDRYLVGDISFSGNESFPSERLAREIRLAGSEPFSPVTLRSDVGALQDFYRQRGYIDVSVRPRDVFNPRTGNIDVVYSIRENEIFHVNRLDIVGNTITRDRVIRRELPIYPGEIIDGLKLRRSRERLLNLGYFEEVIIEPVPSEVPGRKDLLIEVQEKKTGELMFGFGYSSIDDFIGFGEIGLGNFDLFNPPLFQGGGQKLRLRGEIGRKRDNYELSFTEPWLFGIPLSFGVDLYRRRWFWRQYDESRKGFGLRLRRRLLEFVELGLSYQLEEVRVYNVGEDAPEPIKRAGEEGRVLVSSITPSLTRDTRDSFFMPTRGLRTSLSSEIAGGWLGGDRDYVKTQFSNAFYHSVFPGHILSFRFRIGTAQPYGDTEEIPYSEKFFLGGANTIRGFRYREVGPFDPETKSPLGGDSMMLGTAEYTFPIYGIVRGAVFYDIGNVWEGRSWDDSSGNGFNAGAGVGIRLFTPIGPLQFDYAWPVRTGPGGWNDTGGRLHFNLGYFF